LLPIGSALPAHGHQLLLGVSLAALRIAFLFGLEGVAMITVHPGMIARPALESVKTLAVVGSAPAEMFGEFCTAVSEPAPAVQTESLEPGQALLWQRGSGGTPVRLRIAAGKTERRRHTRKYAEGELPPDRSFYFTGPEGKMKLRAQNLFLFAQLAEGIDDDTWLHHLKAGDYSRWFRERIKDDALAADAERVERMEGLDAAESRKLIRQAIERYYTLPASSPLPIPGTDAASRRNP